MNTFKATFALPLVAGVVSLAFCASILAEEKPAASKDAKTTASPPPMDDAAMMAQMMEMAKPGENHKLLADLDGNWSYTVKFWMVPGMPPQEASGLAVRKPAMDGHFFILDVAGKMQMPGPDGKMHDMDFKGMGIEGYDNVKKKFLSTWVDNMGTGIMLSEGTYDPATKTFAYHGEYEMMPGVKIKVRDTVKVIDKDHHVLEWYEDRGGKEAKTMEIAYTRQK